MSHSLFDNQTDPETISLKDGELVLWHDFLGEDQARGLFDHLYQHTAWQQSTILIAGIPRKIPRMNAWHGELDAVYTYSGARFTPHPWTERLLELKQRVQDTTAQVFNSVLINLYRDGSDSVSWHSDNERELGSQPVIASLSLGATRTFQLKHKTDRQLLKLPLGNGSLLLMTGQLQRFWLHRIPKQPSIREPRINCTFRLTERL